MIGDDLLNTRIPAPMQMVMALSSWQSWDYYHSIPYPAHAFGPQQWASERGPFPTALPYVETLVRELAEFTFRNGAPTFSVPDDPDADALLQLIIRQNGLSNTWISNAEANGNQGALAVKFSVDLNDKRCPIPINFLSIPQECRIWVDPHDSDHILMARIQYPYREADGKWYYFREEWTEDTWQQYEPREGGSASISSAAGLPGYANNLGDGDDSAEWHPLAPQPNTFGLVPVGIIRNRRTKGNPFGEGDCWHILRLIDRLALTMHGEDRANQFHSEPTVVALNAEIDNRGQLLPGEPLSARNLDSDGQPMPNGDKADVKLLEPSGAARKWTHEDIDKWEDWIYKAVGVSRVNPTDITNKGNMTELALRIAYGRTISSADRKRELWGNSGMAPFFANLLVALKRMGGIPEVANVPDDVQVSCEWPNYFEPTPQDVDTITNRTIKQQDNGLATPDMAAERVAIAEKVPKNEIPQLLKDLQAHRETMRQQKLADQQISTGDSSGSGIGDLAAASGANNFTS